MNDEKITLSINGTSVTVKKGTTVYEAAKNIGTEIPIFCYQDRMPPFGACRMCLVEVEKMPKLQTSCTLLATEGMNVKTETAKAVNGRKGILELLLINHPLDCPICDKGGECPLQENVFEHGPGISEFFEEKRHFAKALHLGPVLTVDRERCIICARCTRFGEEIAGDNALEFVERGFRTVIGTPDDKPAESKFIGNAIQICPVGALTSQVYRFRARPWDNQPINSTCTLCPVGCSMIFDNRDGQIMRTRSLENRDVNDIWLCDKGFFGYQFASDPKRLKRPLIRKNGKLEETTYEEAFVLIAKELQEATTNKKIAAFGGNTLTTEENFLFQKLMRDVYKSDHLDHRIGVSANNYTGMEISIGECEDLSYVFLLGVDLTEEFPVIWLRLKQAINKGAKVIFLGHYKSEISEFFSDNIIHAPGLEDKAIKEHLPRLLHLAEEGKKGAIFVGSQYLNVKNSSYLLSELIKVKDNTKSLTLNILSGSGNSMGARLAGMLPNIGPLGKSVNQGFTAIDVLKESEKNGWDVLYVAGANPAAKFSENLFSKAREKLKFLIVQDLFLTETANLADVVLPTHCYMEKEGCFINIEGRVQNLQVGQDAPCGVYSDKEIFVEIARRAGVSLEIDEEFQSVLNQNLIRIVPDVIKGDAISNVENIGKDAGMLAATFSKKLFDHGVRMQHNEQLVQLAKEPAFRINQAEGLKLGLIEGSLSEVECNGTSVKGIVQFDDGVADGTIVLPLGFPEVPVHNLVDELYNGLMVKVTPCKD
jgi:NADH-quinone oxidoreductase subunit G